MKRFVYLMILLSYLALMSVSCQSGQQSDHGHTHDHGEQTHEHTHGEDDHEHHEQEEFIVNDSIDHAHDEQHEHEHDHEHDDDHQH